MHRYGNYVIRVLAEQGPEQVKATLHNTLRKHLVRLARTGLNLSLDMLPPGVPGRETSFFVQSSHVLLDEQAISTVAHICSVPVFV